MTLPRIKLDHLFILSDDTGVFQHGTHGVPDPREGYCTDDVARAIVFACRYPFGRPPAKLRELLARCVTFLNFANREDGTFHNFMSYDRKWLDTIGSEDSQGRALWAAGTAARSAVLHRAGRDASEEIFRRSAGRIAGFTSPRSISFGMLGCAAAADIDVSQDMLRHGAEFLVDLFNRNSDGNWRWFENSLTYCNARIPQALLAAYEVTGKQAYRDVAEVSLQFLIDVLFEAGRLEIPGNNGWFVKGGVKAPFDQQPVEAGVMVEALSDAYRILANTEYLRRAAQALLWYHGRNRLGETLIDPSTGACRDGLTPLGVNRNQGAEAVLSYLLARAAYDTVAAAEARLPKVSVS